MRILLNFQIYELVIKIGPNKFIPVCIRLRLDRDGLIPN